MGKTHLMQAVGHRVLQKNPKAAVLYVTAEQFMMEVIELLQEGNLQSMRERYRQLDLLLVDDIQFLASSESTQEEFFHTFNELHHGGKQIIMTSDRPPKMLTTLEDRLRSRFEWGLIADIKQTNLETRVAILRKKEVHLNGMKLGDDIRLYIASRLKSNIRELEGFLRRIQAYAQLNNQQISLPLVREIMRELLPPQEWEEGEEAAAAEMSAAAASGSDVSLPPPHVGPADAPGFSPGRLSSPEPALDIPHAAAPPPPSAPAESGGDRSLTESLLELGSSLGFGSTASSPSPSAPPASGGWPPPNAQPPAPPAPRGWPPPNAQPPVPETPPPPSSPPTVPPPIPVPPSTQSYEDSRRPSVPTHPPLVSPSSGGVTIEPTSPVSPPPPTASPIPPVEAGGGTAVAGLTEAFSAPPEVPAGGGLEELPPSGIPPNPNAILTAFFFPRGRLTELSQLKQKFQDIIKKHKLKFEMDSGAEAGYPADQTVVFPDFLEVCRKHQLSVAIVLGPPPDGRLQETIFHQRLQDTFDSNEVSLQFIPWDELTKDYRYLNIALDITLIRFNKQRGRK